MENNEQECKEVFEDISFILSHRIRSPVATMQGLVNLIQMDAFEQGELDKVFFYFEKCICELELNCKELKKLVFQQKYGVHSASNQFENIVHLK